MGAGAPPAPPLLSRVDWCGTAEADRLASEELTRLRPPVAVRAAIVEAEALYLAAVTVGAAALEAQLAWAHHGVAAGPTRFPRKRVRFITRPKRRWTLLGEPVALGLPDRRPPPPPSRRACSSDCAVG